MCLKKILKTTNYKLQTRGFTLPELLVTMAIIGVLSSIGTVSFNSARMSARDVKRASDMKQTQTALELFFENHSYYPGDGQKGPDGLIIGQPETRILSDKGFGPVQSGTIYMFVPKNPEPNGSPYVFRSLDNAGADCDEEKCGSYAILFTLEKTQGSLLAGPHALTPSGMAGAEGGAAGAGVYGAGGKITGIEGAQQSLVRLADQATFGVEHFVADPRVQAVTETAVAPTAVVAAAANTAVAAHASSFALPYLFSFFTQPALMFGRKKRRAWGVVYNSLSKLPEDLVIVRLRDAATGRVVKSTVTDAHGRYSFLVHKGRYRIEVVKGSFQFPSTLLAGAKEDGHYIDLYHGEVIEVGDEGAVLTPNIPIDPAVNADSDAVVIRKDSVRHFQQAFAVIGPVLGGVSFAIKPSLLVGLLFLAQILVYMIFRRLAAAKHPKSWGIVYEERSSKPIPHAVVRIFAMPYHKLLETQVTDRHGRYSFRVGNNIYYLTVTKDGYLKTETDPLDLSVIAEPTVIASDLPLRQGQGTNKNAPKLPPAQIPPPLPPAPPVTQPPLLPPEQPSQESAPARPPVSPSSTPGDTA